MSRASNQAIFPSSLIAAPAGLTVQQVADQVLVAGFGERRVGEGTAFEELLFRGQEVTGLAADGAAEQGIVNGLGGELVHLVFAAAMINGVQRAVFAQGDGAGAGEEFAAAFLRLDENPQGQTGEVVAGQPGLGGEVAVGIEFRERIAFAGGNVVFQ